MCSEVVLDFIKNFEQSKETFTQGCCYWFALILKERFKGTIYYIPEENHFICGIGSAYHRDYYDINGIYDVSKHSFYDWDEYEYIDFIHYQRIVRDCVLKMN